MSFEDEGDRFSPHSAAESLDINRGGEETVFSPQSATGSLEISRGGEAQIVDGMLEPGARSQWQLAAT